jgi:hypothetical protein
MIKTKIVIEEKTEKRIYQFECDAESPLGEIHDILCIMKASIVEKIKEAQKIEEDSQKKLSPEE